jgi:hypothetical protein
MIVTFTSTYGSCHGHDCIIVKFTSTYAACHGHDCMIVGFSMTATIGIEVNPTIKQSTP